MLHLIVQFWQVLHGIIKKAVARRAFPGTVKLALSLLPSGLARTCLNSEQRCRQALLRLLKRVLLALRGGPVGSQADEAKTKYGGPAPIMLSELGTQVDGTLERGAGTSVESPSGQRHLPSRGPCCQRFTPRSPDTAPSTPNASGRQVDGGSRAGLGGMPPPGPRL